MSIPRSVADVIQNHVTLEVEGSDRMYLNVYQPKLQTELGAVGFFRFHRNGRKRAEEKGEEKGSGVIDFTRTGQMQKSLNNY
ncbi:MAG: hypothetical protein HYX68_28890 [Planctomycetes bacterium]|nr:hypothetical protein [Planctomycetota bacterium]